MNYKEMLEKTMVLIVGIVKGVNSFTSDKSGKTYYSVDFEVKATKFPINIKLPENFDRSGLKEYELAKIQCMIRPTFDRKGIELHAV